MMAMRTKRDQGTGLHAFGEHCQEAEGAMKNVEEISRDRIAVFVASNNSIVSPNHYNGRGHGLGKTVFFDHLSQGLCVCFFDPNNLIP